MARRKTGPRPVVRTVRRTALLVGEGDAEEVLLRHLRKLYTHGGLGFSVTIKNAHGKGAGHVVECAIRASANAAYDLCAALLDTDEGWSDAVRRKARAKSIRVVESQPCCEAWLLDIAGRAAERRSAEHKREFERLFGLPTHDPIVYIRHFPREVLDAARTRVSTLDQLLAMFGV
jgi:hypothetical protein